MHIFWAMEIIPIFFREYRTFIMFYFLFQAQNEVFGAAVAEIASQQQLYPQTGNQTHYI